jgi:glycosyltransferase involved in cell wall biosynthesis
MKTVAIIPAYNEESRVFAAITDAASHVDAVVVVDDCSRDKTGEQAMRAGAHVLRHVINRGQGAALQTGTDYAIYMLDADCIVHFDADGQMRGEDIPKMILPIENEVADVVLGSRFMGIESENMPRSRKLTLKAALLFTRTVSGIRISDPHCGLRAFSRDAAAYMQFKQDRMAHASEVHDLIKSYDLNYVSKAVAIRYTEETLEKGMSFFDGFKVLKDYFTAKFFDTL